MKPSKAHCNECSGERNHEVLHSEQTSWSDDKWGFSGSDTYETLRCMGCETIKLRHTSWFSEENEPTISYFPPAIFRSKPEWFKNLSQEIPSSENFVNLLLNEIYVALQNDSPHLAAMGVRSLIERVMVAKTGDLGSFAKNMAKFETLGYVSRIQRDRLEAILEAGHATIHRSFSPSTQDVITLVDIAEHIVETVYLHEAKIMELKSRVPPRAKG